MTGVQTCALPIYSIAVSLQSDIRYSRINISYLLPKQRKTGCLFEKASGMGLEVPPRFELGNKGFADLCLTTWLWRRVVTNNKRRRMWLRLLSCCKWSGRRDSNSRRSPWQGDALPLSHSRIFCFGADEETRTPMSLTLDPKSSASANSATSANCYYYLCWWPIRDLNPGHHD